MFSSSAWKILLGVGLSASACVAAYGAPIGVQMVNPGVPPTIASSVTIDGTTVNNVYVGPYTLLINGQDISALCIDFYDETTIGETWTADETAVGSSNLSNTYHPADAQEYEEVTYLFSEILQPGADRTGLQEAAWEIMAYGITSSSYITQDHFDNSYIDGALANYTTLNDANYAIVSDTDTGSGRVQEFIIDVAPEPPSFLLLLGPTLIAAAFAFRRYKRAAFFAQ